MPENSSPKAEHGMRPRVPLDTRISFSKFAEMLTIYHLCTIVSSNLLFPVLAVEIGDKNCYNLFGSTRVLQRFPALCSVHFPNDAVDFSAWINPGLCGGCYFVQRKLRSALRHINP
jgi:hypothetical protein